MKASNKTKSINSSEAVKKDKFNLPSHNALAQILTNNSFILAGAENEVHLETKREPTRPEATTVDKPNINHTYQIHQPYRRPPLHNFEDGLHLAGINSVQTEEVENFHLALSRMADDIIVLKTQVLTLEAENSQLCIALSEHQDLKTDLLDDSDINSMTQAEISTHIASLKFKLTSECSRIQQLQNDLIKKNDSEKELLELQRVHQQQQEHLRQHQSCFAKMVTLEATVKQQDEVIEKMKKTLDSNIKLGNNQSVDKILVVKKQKGETQRKKEEELSALAEENRCLRKEMERIQKHHNSLFIQQSEQTKDERQILLQRAEQAEARAQTLEAQLEENSKQWGRQKQDMLTKLSEHRRGFVRTSTITFHKDPLVEL